MLPLAGTPSLALPWARATPLNLVFDVARLPRVSVNRDNVLRTHTPNENKMSDGGRDRAPLGVEVK